MTPQAINPVIKKDQTAFKVSFFLSTLLLCLIDAKSSLEAFLNRTIFLIANDL